MIKVKFTEIMDAVELHSDMGSSFIHLKTGKICFVGDEIIDAAEDDEYLGWLNEEEIKLVKNYLENPDDFLALPSQYDADEYRMMEDFSSNLADEKMAGQLLITLRGQGAFRRFKDSVILLGIEKDWYKFRDERYKQFILDWCEVNEITLEENHVAQIN